MRSPSDIVDAAECRIAKPEYECRPVTWAAPTVNPGDDDEDDEDDDGKGGGAGNIDPDVDEGYDDEEEDDDDEEPLWAACRTGTALLHRTIPGLLRSGGGTRLHTGHRVRFPPRTRHTARPGY
jgi:hypothetical protein